MKNNLVDEIIKYDKKMDEIAMKTTSCFSFNKKSFLNKYDKEVLEYSQKILDLIIEIAKQENTKELEKIDKKYFNEENTASMMLENYLAVLEFCKNINKDINKVEIDVINQIQNNLKLDDEFEMKNKIQLADCYFQIDNEIKAIQLMLDFIKEYPDEGEAYMCMQNWYMYTKPDINKLAEVIDLAEKNNHIMITDFGYYKLVEFYKSIGDNDNYKKYQQLYDKWKKNRKTINF